MNRSSHTIRAIILLKPGRDAKRQSADAAAVGTPVYYDASQRAAWLRALRPGQTGWVWRLSWLAVPHGGKVRPIADYASVIADLSWRIGEGARVIVGDGKLDSNDKEAWLRAVIAGALQVRSGRVISSGEQSRRGQIGASVIKERAAANLLRTTHVHKLAMVRGLWRSREYPTREARAEAINAELEASGLLRLGSWQTIARALKELESK